MEDEITEISDAFFRSDRVSAQTECAQFANMVSLRRIAIAMEKIAFPLKKTDVGTDE